MKPLKSARREDWPARLAAYIEQRLRVPFAWGVHDCCQFARHAAATVRRRDPSKGIGLRRYRTARGALKLLAALGGIEAIPGRCKLEEIPVAMAGRGDILCADDAEGQSALGVCLGAFAAFPAKDGLVFTPTLSARRAWKV
jgi:hypothetical protein